MAPTRKIERDVSVIPLYFRTIIPRVSFSGMAHRDQSRAMDVEMGVSEKHEPRMSFRLYEAFLAEGGTDLGRTLVHDTLSGAAGMDALHKRWAFLVELTLGGRKSVELKKGSKSYVLARELVEYAKKCHQAKLDRNVNESANEIGGSFDGLVDIRTEDIKRLEEALMTSSVPNGREVLEADDKHQGKPS